IEALLDSLPETPLIAYGWQADLETIRQAMLAGARDFLVMPIDADRLGGSILSVLESEERKRLRLAGQTKGLGPRGLVVAVFGAKGGVGKTTVATNLSVGLSSELGQSVVLVDTDTGFGDVAGMLDMKPDRTIIDLLRDADEVEGDSLDNYVARHSSGLSVVAAPRDSLAWRSVAPERLRKGIALLAKRFDTVIIDTAGALSDLSMTTLEESNLVLWITSSDFASINDSLQALETLRQLSYPEGRIRLMLNDVFADDGVRPAKIEQALRRQFFWRVPYDRRLRLGGQEGQPLVMSDPASPGARSILDLAHALTGNGRKQSGSRSFLRRLLGRQRAEHGATAVVAEGRR
ncbi:MAG: AAA family ATPase, partial [Dehalococcoidia bacterium]|nr:AAA family ATPase [Dehalococcoidia bacterium]